MIAGTGERTRTGRERDGHAERLRIAGGDPEENITDKITRRVLAGDKSMMVWLRIKAGAHAAAHSHPHEQIVWILKGRMDFRIGEERRMLAGGDVAVIRGGVEHEAWCREDAEVVDMFSPPREDFLSAGTPAYMRES